MSALVPAFFASVLVALTVREASSFAIDFSVDDLHFTTEDIERDLFDLFERLGS